VFLVLKNQKNRETKRETEKTKLKIGWRRAEKIKMGGQKGEIRRGADETPAEKRYALKLAVLKYPCC
jgi:hypothetical protein